MHAAYLAASPTSKGILLMLAAIALFTGMDAIAKGLVAEYPTLQVVWARYTGQTVLVALWLAPRLRQLLRTRYPKMQALRSAFQFGATAFFFFSIGWIGLAEATAITDINPVLITLGAAVFLGEKLGPRRILGVLVALCGAMIIIRPGSAVFSLTALLPLGCAICYAGYAIATRWVGRNEDAWTSLIYAALLGTLLTSAIMPFVWQPIAAGDVLRFLALGFLGAGAQFLLIRAFTTAEVSAIAPFGYMGIVFATFWGALLYDEFPDRWTIIGALVIVGAGLYVWHRETRAAQPNIQGANIE